MNRWIQTGIAALCLSIAWPSNSQWSRVEIDGEQMCVRNTGEVIDPQYISSRWSSSRCESFNIFESWLGTAEAVTVRRQLTQNPDGSYDEAFPNGDKSVQSSVPMGWDDITIQGTANPYDSCSTNYDDVGVGVAETFNLSVTKGSIYYTDDSYCGWRYDLGTSTDATVDVQLVEATQSANNEKSGIDIRESLDADSARIGCFIWHNGDFVCDQRTRTGGTTSVSVDLDLNFTLPVYLRAELDRATDAATFYTSPDGMTWTERFQAFPSWLGTGNLYAGLATTPSSDLSDTSDAHFDSQSVDTTDVGSSGTTVGLSSDSYTCSEDMSTCTITVERAGSGSGACSVDYSFADGSALAGTHYTNSSGTVSFSDSDLADKTYDLTGIVNVDGNKNLTTSIVKNTCAGDTLGTSSADITIQDNDAVGVTFYAPGDDSQEFYNKNLGQFPSYQLCCGSPDSYLFGINDGTSHTYDAPTTPRLGSGFFRMQRLEAQQNAGTYPPCCTDGHNGNRSLINVPDDDGSESLTFYDYNEDVWYAFSLWIPNDLPQTPGTRSAGWNFISGVHGSQGGHPSWLSMQLHGANNFDIELRYTTENLESCGCSWWDRPASGLTEVAVLDNYNIPRSQWVDVVMRMKFHGTNGILQVWIDDVLVGDYSGPFGDPGHSTGENYAYPYVGPYIDDDWAIDAVYYFDEFRAGNENASYADMSPNPND